MKDDNKDCKCKSKCHCRSDDYYYDDKHCKCKSKPCCCPSDHKPAQVLTTGPFRVPETSISRSFIDTLIIGLKNHTNKQRTVRVTVDRCPEAVFPDTSEETTTFSQRVTLEPHECTQIQISGVLVSPPFVLGDLIRVTFTGDICKEATEIEATVVGKDVNLVQEPTMFFRHDDLVKTCPEHF